MPPNPDRDTLTLLRRRDPRGFDQAYASYGTRLYSFLYRLVGPREKVYRCSEVHKGHIEPVPAYEDVAVHQLIDAKWLHVGGNHPCKYHGREGYGRSILVPRRTKEAMARWRAYKRPTTWGPVRHAKPGA